MWRCFACWSSGIATGTRDMPFHMLGNREDAEEALQDAFTRAYRSLARCEDPERFGAWLFRILVNRCRTIGARRGRRAQTFVVDEGALLEAAEEHPADAGCWREEIDRALERLRADQREAFLSEVRGRDWVTTKCRSSPESGCRR